MIEVRSTAEFDRFVGKLTDRAGRARILARLDRLATGNFGDWKSVGGGVAELRIQTGPGYRVYFARRGDTVVILLCGGDKSSQQRDIDRARELAALLQD